jgi:hypothetical protein
MVVPAAVDPSLLCKRARIQAFRGYAVQQARALNLVQAMVEHNTLYHVRSPRWIPTRELPRWECLESNVDCWLKALPYFDLAGGVCWPVDFMHGHCFGWALRLLDFVSYSLSLVDTCSRTA